MPTYVARRLLCAIPLLFVISMLAFWFGLLAILVFSLKLRWLPTAGRHSIGSESS